MKKLVIPLLSIFLLLQACNLPSGAPVTPTLTIATPTLSVPTAAPASTDTPAPIPTLQNPLVLRDTLCWVGPGNQYDVVSALQANTRVELLGRGVIAGWWVISNPIYKDACWVQAVDVQIEPGFDTTNLVSINPPPLPTPTWTPSPTATPTP